jgi:Zn-dependent protease with chaperone function
VSIPHATFPQNKVSVNLKPSIKIRIPMSDNLYPRSPQVEKSFTEPPAEYSANVVRVMLSIVFFMVVYLLLLVAAGYMLYYSFFGAAIIIGFRPGFYTIAAGLGLIALAGMFSWFMIKFVFKTYKDVDSARIQITEKDHPKLFDFVRKLSDEIQAPFPAKIFLTPDVNASVFYNSSFLSMFLPVRKNLNIGLGLVNALNMSEFKAVLAHEFGHFSQRSMKLGSYFYTVNRMLYNLLYEYDSWDETLVKWSEIGGVFGFFAVITSALVNTVRRLLQKVYELISVNYFGLSRAMEFHADLVAVSVAGSAPMAHALRRIEFASSVFGSTINQLNTFAEKGQYTNNLYRSYNILSDYNAGLFKLSLHHGRPVITDEAVKKFEVKSRLIVKDLYATHPPTSERIQNINRHLAEGEFSEASPWLLFENSEELQQKMTRHFCNLNYPGKQLSPDHAEQIDAEMQTTLEEERPDDRYKGYYIGRHLEQFNVWEAADNIPENLSDNDVYSEEIRSLIDKFNSVRQDLAVLKEIKEGKTHISQFEFDGVKYKVKNENISGPIKELSKEEVELKSWLTDQDRKSFQLHFRALKLNDPQLAENYKAIFSDYFTLLKFTAEVQSAALSLQKCHIKLVTTMNWTEEDFKNTMKRLSRARDGYYNIFSKMEGMKFEWIKREGKESLRDFILEESPAPLNTNPLNTAEYEIFISQAFTVFSKFEDSANFCLRKILLMQKQTNEKSLV